MQDDRCCQERVRDVSLRRSMFPINEKTRSEVTEDGGQDRYERATLVRLVIFGHSYAKLILH